MELDMKSQNAPVIVQPLDRILRLKEVKEKSGLSDTTIWRERKAGRFPEPIKITDRLNGWPESVIRAWVAEKKRASESTVESANESGRQVRDQIGYENAEIRAGNAADLDNPESRAKHRGTSNRDSA
jgi:prophage regulatory protein